MRDYKFNTESNNSLIVSPIGNNSIIYDYLKLKADTTMGTLSATNRRVLILTPGTYNIDGTFSNGAKVIDGLVLDTEFIDIVAVGKNPEDTIITSANFDDDPGPTAVGQTVELDSDNVTLAGFTIHSSASQASGHAFHVMNSGSGVRVVDMAFRHDNASLTGTIPCRFFKQNSHAGEFIRCVSDQGGFTHGGSAGTTFGVNFTDCISPNSGILQTGNASDGFIGTIRNCIFKDCINTGPMEIADGGKIINSFLSADTNNVDAFNVIESGPVFYNSTLLVKQGGTGIPVNDDGSAWNITMSQCRMNNATNDPDGIGTNITNLIGAPLNVVDDDVI
jgi:hypothetical protein